MGLRHAERVIVQHIIALQHTEPHGPLLRLPNNKPSEQLIQMINAW
jgi:hypothetical protein